MRKFFQAILPLLGAAGFVFFGELSVRRPAEEFLWWSLAAAVWILLFFMLLALGRLRGRLIWVTVPTVLMIAVSTVVSLMFFDLISPLRGVIIFFAVILYLFFEHVRHEIESPSETERLRIADFARMINIGSMFLVVTVALGTSIFLSVPFFWTVAPVVIAAFLWSWHLYLVCTDKCGEPWSRVLITTLIIAETYLVALRLPTTMFVGGALVGIVYYLAANLLPLGETGAIPAKVVRRFFLIGALMILAILLTARWVD